jgi:cleavage stimulation factor subunit 2
MLMQVLSLTPDQINALPPDERNAIQQLVNFDIISAFEISP